MQVGIAYKSSAVCFSFEFSHWPNGAKYETLQLLNERQMGAVEEHSPRQFRLRSFLIVTSYELVSKSH